MARRPIQEKKLRRLRKAVGRTPLPAYIDLIDWLKTRGHADTSGQARKLILAERVKSESHTLGIQRTGAGVVLDGQWPRVPARHAASIRVVPAE